MANRYGDRWNDDDVARRNRSYYGRDYDQWDYGQRDFDRDYERGRYAQDTPYSRERDYGYAGRDFDRDYNRFGSQGRSDYGYDYGRESPGGYGSDYGWQGRGGYGSDYGRQDRGYDYGRRGRSDYGFDYGRQGWADYGAGNRGQGDYGYNRGNYGPESFGATDYDYGRFRSAPSWTYEEWWFIPGPFTGRGPRNYQRSDDRICEDISDRLTQAGNLDASDIDIEVNNGEVTLKGNVDNRQSKRMAEDLAESVSGVRDVHNQLHVTQQGQSNRQGQFGQGSQMGQTNRPGQSGQAGQTSQSNWQSQPNQQNQQNR